MLLWTITGVWSLDVPLDYHWGLESRCFSGLSLGFGVLMLLWTITGVWSLDVSLDYHWGFESRCFSGLSLGFEVLMLLWTISRARGICWTVT